MQFTLNIPQKLGRYTNDELCLANPDLRIERNSKRELIFMSPTVFGSASMEVDLKFSVKLSGQDVLVGLEVCLNDLFAIK